MLLLAKIAGGGDEKNRKNCLKLIDVGIYSILYGNALVQRFLTKLSNVKNMRK